MLTAVVLTKNSAKTITRCLSSLDFCNALLVVDDESADDTVKIARQMGAAVIVRPLAGDFAAQRNAGLTEVTAGWVLFVDSDEVVTAELAGEILQATREKSFNGYFLRRHDILFGRTLTRGEIGAVRLLRMAKKNSGSWIRPVHEVWQVTGPTRTLTNPLLHYPHQTISEFIAGINGYSDLEARMLFQKRVGIPAWQLVLYPFGKFIQNYFFRAGFRDGMGGLVVAVLMSFHSFLVRGKTYLLQHRHGQ